MANPVLILFLFFVSIAALLTAVYLIHLHATAAALTRAKEQLSLRKEGDLQQEIAKLEQASTADRADFQTALEQYNAKYRNTNASSKPPGGPGSQG